MGSRTSIDAHRIDNDQASVVRVLYEYYSAFSTLNVAFLPFFHEPLVLISPKGYSRRPPTSTHRYPRQ